MSMMGKKYLEFLLFYADESSIGLLWLNKKLNLQNKK